MFEVIKWQASLRVANERKVAKILQRYCVMSGQEMTVESCERYWKDRSLFQVRFTSPLHVENVDEAIFQTLCTCGKLYTNWTVAGPFGYAGGLWEFRGDSMDHAQGVVAIGFAVNNFAVKDD